MNTKRVYSLAKLQRKILQAGALSFAFTALHAAPFTILTENFDSYTGAATSLTDTATANPPWPQAIAQDDTPVAPLAAGTGIQLVNFLAASGTQSLLLRSGSEAQIHIQQPRSGSRYQLDFKLNTAKGAGDRNFYIIVRAMGNDTNGEDFMAYRSDRAPGNATFYYDGIDTGGWTATGAGPGD